MHDDLAPTTGAILANTKVLTCFIVGILYLISAIGIFRKKYSLAMAGMLGFILFDGLYIVQIILYADIHPRIWFDFSVFGGLSFLIGLFSFWHWRIRKVAAES